MNLFDNFLGKFTSIIVHLFLKREDLIIFSIKPTKIISNFFEQKNINHVIFCLKSKVQMLFISPYNYKREYQFC